MDNTYTQYTHHQNIRLIYSQSSNIYWQLPYKTREFLNYYFRTYPSRTLIKFDVNKHYYIRVKNKSIMIQVVEVDSSMVKVFFKNENKFEWIYRGSMQFKEIAKIVNSKKFDNSTVNKFSAHLFKEPIDTEIYSSVINLDYRTHSFDCQDKIENLQISLNCIKPVPIRPHKCNFMCMINIKYDVEKTKYVSALSIPLHFGFTRTTRNNIVYYTTPCGRFINNIADMNSYLNTVSNNQLTIDLFSFSHMINPLKTLKVSTKFTYIHDISDGIEFKPISLINYINNSLPIFVKYIKDRDLKHGVNLDLDPKSLIMCECVDNCQNAEKCQCRKLTYDNYQHIFKIFDKNIGYDFKRLNERVLTGIYECNPNCRCNKTCLNRVVQENIKCNLQLFLTDNKGWGLRTLSDIPKGTFICNLVGEIMAERDARNNIYEMYQAELDYIEIIEQYKEDYESVVLGEENDLDDNIDSSNRSSCSSEKEFNVQINLVNERKTNKRKNDTRQNLKKFKPVQLPEANEKQKIKPLRHFLDKNEEIYVLDAKYSGNISRFINHSCEPNLFCQNVFVDTLDPRFPWVSLFSFEDILTGTELTLDYNYTIGVFPDQQIQCNCGASNCRGRLL